MTSGNAHSSAAWFPMIAGTATVYRDNLLELERNGNPTNSYLAITSQLAEGKSVTGFDNLPVLYSGLFFGAGPIAKWSRGEKAELFNLDLSKPTLRKAP
jgi:hypothetical protein